MHLKDICVSDGDDDSGSHLESLESLGLNTVVKVLLPLRRVAERPIRI